MRRPLVVCAVLLFPWVVGAENLMWGDLQPGPSPVGFRVDLQYDASRAERPLLTLEGAARHGSSLRPLEITMWYPARPAPASRSMRFGDYMTYADDIISDRAGEGAADADAETRRRNAVHGFATFGIFSRAPESAWTPLLESTMLAVRDATAASGRFPVILFAPGANGSAAFVAPSCEYLASQGYVVLSVPSRGQNALNDRLSGGAFYESQTRDLEYLIAYASHLKFADTSRIGVFAWSRGGAAAVLLAMRDSRVTAVVGWDAVALESKREAERLRESPFYDADRLTVPILEIRSGNPGAPPALFDSLRFARRYWINAEGVHHLDFSVAAIIHTALGVKNQYIKLPAEKIRAAHASINIATRRFFDSFVSARGDFSATDLQPSDLFSFAKSEAAAAPPSASLLLERIYTKNGIVSARTIIETARRTSPQWRPFPEPILDITGNRMIELGRSEEAIQVLQLNTDLYPESARTWASLGAAQEKAGQNDAAAQSFQRALSLDPKNETAAAGLPRVKKVE